MPILPGAEPFQHDGGDVGVLLCHGLTGTPQSLRGWAQALAEAGHTVRLPLLPGHGTRWQDMNDTGWADWYGAVSTALDDLVPRCRTLVVAGLSMGGALALRLAADRGPDVHGLILVNPAVLAEDPRLRLLPLLKWVIPAVPGIGSDIKRPGITELAYTRTPTRAVDSLQHGWAELRRDLPQVNQPLLVLRSAEDHVVPASSTQLILDTVTSEQRREIVLLDSYHVATLDNDADRIIAESLTFLTQVTQPAGGGQ